MRLSRQPPAPSTRRAMDNIVRLLVLSLCGLVAGEPLGRLLARRRDSLAVYAREFAREYEPYMFAAIPLHAPVPVLRVLTRAPLQPLQPLPASHRTSQLVQRAPDAQAASSAQHAAYARPYLSAAHYPQPTPQYAEQTRLYPRWQQYAGAAEPQYGESGRQYNELMRHYAKPARPYAAEPDYEASSYELARPAYYPKPRRQVSSAEAPSAYEYMPHAPPPRPQLAYALAPYDSDAFASQEVGPTVLYARPSPSGGYTYRRVPSLTSLPNKKVSVPLKEKEKDSPYILKIHKYRIVKDDLI